MGIQIKGQNDNITSTDGSLEITGITTFNTQLDIGTVVKLGSAGIVTASNFKTGISNLHDVGLTLTGGQLDVGSNIKIGNAGVVTATSFVGSLSGGSVSGTSGAFTGNIDLNSDTNKLKIGAGDDFQFFHNGSNNFIETNNGDIRIKTSDSSGNLTFTAGGNTESFRINSSGKVIIGNSGTPFGNAAVQAFIQHGNTAGESGFSSVDTTSVAQGVGGEIAFHGKYNTGAQDWAYFGHIRGIKENATNGNTACALTFHTRPNATAPQERVRITSDGFIGINDTTPYNGLSINKEGDYWDTN